MLGGGGGGETGYICLVIDSSGLFLLFSYRFKWAFSSVWLSVHVFFPLSLGYRLIFFRLFFFFFFILFLFYFLSIHVVPRPSPSTWLSIRLSPPFFFFLNSVWLSIHVGFFLLLFSYQFMQCFVLSCGDCGVSNLCCREGET